MRVFPLFFLVHIAKDLSVVISTENHILVLLMFSITFCSLFFISALIIMIFFLQGSFRFSLLFFVVL